jgi:hypothetical protein
LIAFFPGLCVGLGFSSSFLASAFGLPPGPATGRGWRIKNVAKCMNMLAGRFGSSECASRSGGSLAPNVFLCWIGQKHVLEFGFLVVAHGTPGHLIYFETILDCRFCVCTQGIVFFDVLVDGIFVVVYGTPGHFAYFETTLICIFCRRTRCSRGIWLTSKRPWIADFVTLHGLRGICVT